MPAITNRPIADAKWWIDHRDLTDADLLATVSHDADATMTPVDHIQPAAPSQAA